MNARTHLNHVEKHQYTPYVILPNGTQGYLYNGLIVPRSVFLKKFPLPEEVHVGEREQKRYINNWSKQ